MCQWILNYNSWALNMLRQVLFTGMLNGYSGCVLGVGGGTAWLEYTSIAVIGCKINRLDTQALFLTNVTYVTEWSMLFFAHNSIQKSHPI